MSVQTGKAMMDVSMRAATAADLPDILRILRSLAQPGLDDGRVLSNEAAAAIFERMSRYPNYAVHVATNRDGDVVGTFALLIMDNLGHQGAPSAVVEDVCVDGRFQGQGIGRAMMAHAMDLARRHGCYKLTLSSNAARERAHEFYRKLGFEPHGVSFHVRLAKGPAPTS